MLVCVSSTDSDRAKDEKPGERKKIINQSLQPQALDWHGVPVTTIVNFLCLTTDQGGSKLTHSEAIFVYCLTRKIPFLISFDKYTSIANTHTQFSTHSLAASLLSSSTSLFGMKLAWWQLNLPCLHFLVGRPTEFDIQVIVSHEVKWVWIGKSKHNQNQECARLVQSQLWYFVIDFVGLNTPLGSY